VPNKLQFTREKHLKTTYLRWEGLENVKRRRMKKNSKNTLSLSLQKGGKGQTHMSKNWGTIGKRENSNLGCNLGLILSHETPATF
jgi:hypothetical protein